MLYTTQRNNYCLTVPMPGFYRDGGLAVLKNKSGRNQEKIKKSI